MLLETWTATRRGLVAELEGCGPGEWSRRGEHSIVGPYSLADMARAWVDHDLSHRAQMTRALRGPA